MPLKTVLPNSLAAVPNVGAGPAKNMDAPSAILSVRVGLRRYSAPPRCVLVCFRVRLLRLGARRLLAVRFRPAIV